MKHPGLPALGLIALLLFSGCHCCRPVGHRLHHGFAPACPTGACPPGPMIGPLQPQPMPQGSMYAPQGSLHIDHGMAHSHMPVPMTASAVPMESLPTY